MLSARARAPAGARGPAQPAVKVTMLPRNPCPFYVDIVNNESSPILVGAHIESPASSAKEYINPGYSYMIPKHQYNQWAGSNNQVNLDPPPDLADAEDITEHYRIPIHNIRGIRATEVLPTARKKIEEGYVEANGKHAFMYLPSLDTHILSRVSVSRNITGWQEFMKLRFGFYSTIVCELSHNIKSLRDRNPNEEINVSAIHLTLSPDPRHLRNVQGGILAALRALARGLSAPRERLDAMGLQKMLWCVGGGPDEFTKPNVEDSSNGDIVLYRDGDYHVHICLGMMNFPKCHPGCLTSAEAQKDMRDLLHFFRRCGFGVDLYENIADPDDLINMNYFQAVDVNPRTLMMIFGYDCAGKGGLKASKW
eukprot:CAMPEP_0178497232 /NCGR_PEP_ID=MMETSP0696-20121128/14569_1 /TAXON_ID=265572 /ORGANISM="Extubocellulus spinifer, Strain CCMP396" /LENGTH=365 /DNA_ID=CAMNT_0020125625 /DNA_START=64 /DNA_END=1158 /DNA_ORIENTATION=-